MKPVLSIYGGVRSLTTPLEKYNPIGEEEKSAVMSVLDSGLLSGYVADWDDGFDGGINVQELEKEWSNYFGVKHAVAVNSWTSGLVAAVGALALEPGDEIIVTPWTMSATVAAILHWNLIPVFSDIDERTFNLDPNILELSITKFTKAIMVADIFGQSCDIESIRKIADKHGLKIIVDSAHAIGSTRNDYFSGTLGDIGGFSLNRHKHIHTGEGGIIVTNSDELALKCKLIRNHAEVVVNNSRVPIYSLSNMIGHNFRLGELQSAVGRVQLKKLENTVARRQEIAENLNDGLQELEGLVIPFVDSNNTHSYYVYGMQLQNRALGIGRTEIVSALKAEGVPIGIGYQNIHQLPVFKNKIAFGSGGFPWIKGIANREISYEKGICPVAEDLFDHKYIGIGLCNYEFSNQNIDEIILAFKKVWRYFL